MSVQDVDLRKVFKVLLLGVMVWGLAFLLSWGNGAETISAAKQAIGYAVVWIVGNIQETGVALSIDGLRK